MIILDSETDEEVGQREQVKGYELTRNRYVLLDDEHFDQARTDTSSTMTVGKFVDRGSIDPIWFDTSYYVAPDREAGRDVFVVLRDALRDSDRVALSRVVIAQRERKVAILPMGKGMVCRTRTNCVNCTMRCPWSVPSPRRRRMRKWCDWQGKLPSGRLGRSRPRISRTATERACAK